MKPVIYSTINCTTVCSDYQVSINSICCLKGNREVDIFPHGVWGFPHGVKVIMFSICMCSFSGH